MVLTFFSLENTFSWFEAIAESEMRRMTRSLSSIVSYLPRTEIIVRTRDTRNTLLAWRDNNNSININNSINNSNTTTNDNTNNRHALSAPPPPLLLFQQAASRTFSFH